MELISVVVPVYKVEKYLKKCVDSIINQTYSELEIILVDDGSPDNCPAICDEYALKDSRIKVIHKQNGGLSDARNAALDIMTGEYVTFVDSDDYIPENAIKNLYNSMIEFGADVAIGNIDAFYDDGSTEPLYRPTDCAVLLCGEETLSTLNRPNACAKLYKKSTFENIRFPIGKLYEDVFTYHKILARANTIVLTGQVTYFYLIRTGSIMRDEYSIRFTDIIDAVKERYEWLDSIGQPKLANESRMFVYSRVAVAFAHLDKNNPVHAKRLKEIKEIYNECYKILIKDKSVSAKQKFRLWMLYKMPGLHTKLFGKKMPLALG